MNEQISKFLQTRIDAGDFPSAVYLVAEKGEIVFTDALGFAVVEPERIPARLDTIYDLASLTKPLGTGLLLAKLVERQVVDLDEPVSKYLQGLDLGRKTPPSIRDLVSHVSGLPAWIPLYLIAESKYEILDSIIERLPTEQSEVIYSDLNFVLLGLILTKINCEDLWVSIKKAIIEPLSIFNTWYPEVASELKRQVAACEKGNEFERQMCVEKGYIQPPATAGGSDSAFRNHVIWGEVHDNNAYFMGGVAGHAGLFSTAEEVFKIAQQFLPNYTQLLKPETCELFRTNFTPGMNEDRSFAFQLASTKDSPAGTKMSPQSFGHTGFTGTSLWIDPVTERIFVLLTNRTHNHPLPFVNINSVRRTFHDLAIDLLDER